MTANEKKKFVYIHLFSNDPTHSYFTLWFNNVFVNKLISMRLDSSIYNVMYLLYIYMCVCVCVCMYVCIKMYSQRLEIGFCGLIYKFIKYLLFINYLDVWLLFYLLII